MSTTPRSGHDHDASHGHSHGQSPVHEEHSHSHGHDEHFDWAAAADAIRLDASVMAPVVDAALARIELPADGRILDLGSGPAVMGNLLAQLAPGARIVAADGSPDLLEAARAAAASNGVGDRFDTLHVDLDVVPAGELAGVLTGHGEGFDLVWASMVLHHVVDAPGVLRALHDAIVPGGTIVLAELGGDLQIFADGSTHPIVTTGAWARWSAASADTLRAHLPAGATELKWGDELRAAGFVEVASERIAIDHAAPLDEASRAWLSWFLGNGLARGGSSLGEEDRALLSAFVDGLADGDAPADVVISTSRTLVVGTRAA